MRIIPAAVLIALAGCKGTVTIDFGRPLWTAQGRFSAAAIGDINGDGHNDICLESISSSTLDCFLGSPGAVSLDSSWHVTIPYNCDLRPSFYDHRRIAIGDINRDGYGDLAAAGGWRGDSYPPELYLGGPLRAFASKRRSFRSDSAVPRRGAHRRLPYMIICDHMWPYAKRDGQINRGMIKSVV